MAPLTDWLQGGTLALCAWILFEVHRLRVDLEVLRAERLDLTRRVEQLENHNAR